MLDARKFQFDKLQPGDRLPVEQLEKVWEVNRDSDRYRLSLLGLYYSARAAREDLYFALVKGSLVVLKADEALGKNLRDTAKNLRKLVSLANDLSTRINRAQLPEEDRRRYDAAQQFHAGSTLHAKDQARKIRILQQAGEQELLPE